MSDKDGKPSTKGEDELNDLLDNALEDFDKCDNNGKPSTEKEEEKIDIPELWNEEFFTQQAQLLGDRVNSMFGTGNDSLSTDQIAVGFQKMAEAAAIALQGESASSEAEKKYTDSISEALKGLKEGVDNLQAPVAEADIANMFSNISLEGEENDGNPFLPFMQGMMQSLLSAEILLPSIKELLEKYPKYLEQNSAKISEADRERYLKQQELFGVICTDLETEKPDDSSETKQQRFKRVLDNMQKLHEYGQPPDDLVGEVSGGLPGLDGPPGSSQCPLM